MDPDKDLEAKLKNLEKKSKYVPLREISQKIRQGVYQENGKQLKANTKNLTKRLNKWKKKIETGDEKEYKTYLGKYEFGQGLLDLLQGKKKEEKKEEKKVETEFKKATTEEEFALLKRIGEAALSVAPVDIKAKLSEIASLAPESSNSILKAKPEYKEIFEAKTTNFKKGKFNLTDSKDPLVLQAVANAARAFQVEQDKVDFYPVIQKPTLSSGDCFYSALYRSAKERGYLDELVDCLGLDIENEEIFIQSLRNVMADEIYNDRLPGTQTREGYLDSYDFLVVNYASDPLMYKEIIRGFPYWFQKRFAKGPGDKKTFLQELVSHTMTMTEWVGEIEVKIAQRLFKTYCGIEIQTHMEADPVGENDYIQMPKIYKGTPVFHLVNLGEAHYEYYSFKIPISKLKKSSKVDVKEVKEVKGEPCGLIVYDPCTGFPIMEGDPVTIIQDRLKKIQSRSKKGGTRKGGIRSKTFPKH